MNKSNVHDLKEEQEYAKKYVTNIWERLYEYIMSFDSDEIHEACVRAGHSTNWESFDKELDTYSIEDMLNLLDQLTLC